MAEKQAKSAMDTALSYLAYRMRSENEIHTKLTQKQYGQAEIEETMQKLSEYGYINDAAFAAELIRSKTNRKPTGRILLKQALYKAGLDDETIQNALLCYTEEDEQTACDEYYKKLSKQKGKDRGAHVKIQRAMLQRGFDYGKVYSSMKRLSETDFDID